MQLSKSIMAAQKCKKKLSELFCIFECPLLPEVCLNYFNGRKLENFIAQKLPNKFP